MSDHGSKEFCRIDGDSHVVEPPELWTKYLDPEYRTLRKHALWREEGKWGSYLQVNGKMFRDTMNSNLPRHAIWCPGLSWKEVGKLDPNTREHAGQLSEQGASGVAFRHFFHY